MKLMFANFELYKGNNSKMMAFCDSVKQRFDKFVEKAIEKRLG